MAALTPLSVDGMIVAASTTLLADSRAGGRGGVLPWALLAVGSVASLAANVAVAEPSVTGRLIAAWPSFALICSYELLMRHVRRNAARRAVDRALSRRSPVGAVTRTGPRPPPGVAGGWWGRAPPAPRRGRGIRVLDGIGRLLAMFGRGLRALAEAAAPHGYPEHHF